MEDDGGVGVVLEGVVEIVDDGVMVEVCEVVPVGGLVEDDGGVDTEDVGVDGVVVEVSDVVGVRVTVEEGVVDVDAVEGEVERETGEVE